jgi:hypothetical protein
MFTLSVKSNIEDAVRDIRATREQIAIATAKALTFTAERVRDAERREIQQVFDRPTPFTMSSLFMSGATPARLEARVWFKDIGGYGGSRKNVGTAAAHYLVPQVYGGGRGSSSSSSTCSVRACCHLACTQCLAQVQSSMRMAT